MKAVLTTPFIAFVAICIIVSRVNGGPYVFEFIAHKGDAGLMGMNPEVSINDLGRVAFVGQDTASTSSFEDVWIGDGHGLNPTNISPGFSYGTRDFSFPQINNLNEVVARDRVSGRPATFFVRKWPAGTIISRSGTFPQIPNPLPTYTAEKALSPLASN